MIDLHCHILPGLDDGPGSMKESLAMATRAVEDGIHTIVATPHTLNGIYVNHVKKINAKVAALGEALSKHDIQLTLYAGADVCLCPHMLERIKHKDAPTINDAGKYVLLELPSQTIPPGARDELFSLRLNGITPIISHPERNPAIQRDIEVLYEIVRMGALCQVTAMSILGDFGAMAMRCVEMLLVHRLVHVIATDAHSSEVRPPVLSRGVEAAAEILGSHGDAERMVTEIPASILSGDMPEIPEPLPAAKKSRPRQYGIP